MLQSFKFAIVFLLSFNFLPNLLVFMVPPFLECICHIHAANFNSSGKKNQVRIKIREKCGVSLVMCYDLGDGELRIEKGEKKGTGAGRQDEEIEGNLSYFLLTA